MIAKRPSPDELLPTQDEIRERCLEIQSRWTEQERRRRTHGYRQGDGATPTAETWTPPVIAVDELGVTL